MSKNKKHKSKKLQSPKKEEKGTAKSEQKKVNPPKSKQSLGTKNKLTALNLWGGYILAALAFLLYFNTLGHQFAFDDAIVITENQFTQKGTAGIGDLMTRDFFEGIYGDGGMELSGGRYRPLSLVSFAIENQLFGKKKKLPDGSLAKTAKGEQLYEYNPALGHFVNVLLYALTGLLLFQLLRRWFVEQMGWSVAIPFFAGLLFMAHPIHTEVVANIKSRDEILALLLLLISFLQLQGALRGKQPPWRLAIGLLAYFGAMLAKEHAFTFILLFPIGLHVFNRDKTWGDVVKVTWPYWLAAAAYFMLRWAMVGGVAAETNTDLMENPFYGVPFMQKFGTIALILWYYIQMLFFPHPLASDYSREQIPLVGFDHPLAILGLLVYLAMAYWAVTKFWKRDVFAFSILLYFIPLSLTTNILFNIGAPMADRFLYIPSLGFCLAVAYGLGLLLKTQKEQNFFKNPITIGFTAVAILLFSIKTISRNPDWYNNKTLFSKDVQASNNSAKMNYYYANTIFREYLAQPANAAKDTSVLSTAFKHFKRAMEIYPQFHTAMYNLGLIEVQRKNGKAAEDYFLKTLELQPGHILSIEQLGRVYGEFLRDLPKAEQYLLQAVEINTQRGATANLSQNYQGLGIVYAMQQQYNKAIPIYLKAIELDPNVAVNYLNLGITYQQLGDQQKAKQYIDKAIQMDPSLKR
jgi:Tfp pilus assembly protein PilF